MSVRVRNRHDGAQAAQQAADGVRVVGLRRCSRGALLGGTALRAAALVVLAAPAHAQLAANAHPTGGQVTGGSASIAQNGSTTAITQRTGRAAIDWQSFDVGSKAQVTFNQPNAKSVVLNTVVGPNPSEIAGRITANGVVAVINQSGVLFDRGSQVDTAGLIVSAAGITRQNFMAGHMVFDQAPHPGASVVNNGTITIRQAGLAALVAPQVVNNGLIQAKLGRVVLGGASTYTLDLYGDGLLALNVTGQVTSVTIGGRTIPALVTNAGTILADGGSVVLNASAADGLIRTLVEAGGTIAAPGVQNLAGRVLVEGVGGSVDIAGAVSATGVAAGTHGGTVVANATGTVSVASTARIDASGNAGGGLVAIGTTAARARSPAAASTRTAQAASVAAGARIIANATARGQGGQVTVLSTGTTSLGGVITVLGGAAAGDGGHIEVSGEQVPFTGLIDARAPHGKIGGLLIDPGGIVVADVQPGTLDGATFFKPATLEGMHANVTLTTATGDIDFAYSGTATANTLALGTHALTLTTTAGNINIDGGFSISAGPVKMTSSSAVTFDSTTGVAYGLGAAASTSAFLSGSVLGINAGTGSIDLGAATINATTSLALNSTFGNVTSSGVLTTPLLTAAVNGGIALAGSNAIGTTGVLSTTLSNIVLTDGGALTVNGSITALTGNITINTGGTLTILSKVNAAATGTLTLSASAGDIVESAAAAGLIGGTLTGALAGTATLTGGNNDFVDVGGFTTGTGGALSLSEGLHPLQIVGAVTSGGPITLTANNFDVSGSVSTTGLIALSRASMGGYTLNGLVDNFSGNGLAGFTAGTIALGSTDGVHFSALTTSLTLNENLSAAHTLGLFANGDINQLALTGISAAAIEGHAKGAISLAGGGNAFASAGPLTSDSGAITLADSSALATTGTMSASLGLAITVTGASNTLTIAHDLTGSGVTLTAAGTISQTAGTIEATSGAVSLTSAQNVLFGGTLEATHGLVALKGPGIADDAGAGVINAASLSATATSGGIIIGNGANSFATLTGLSATGDATLVDAGGFQAAGPISGGAVSLTAGGTITQTSGTLNATSLSGSASSSVSFTLTGNDVATLTSFTANGFALSQNATLDVAGLVQGGSGASISTGNAALTIAAAGSLTAATLTLDAGSVNAPGALATGLLTGTITNGATLTGANNITAIGSFSAGSIALNDIGGLAIEGNLTGTSGLALTAGGTISQTGGSITTSSLTGSAASSVSLAGTANSVTNLGSFTSAGGFALWSAPSITVTGAVTNTGGGTLLLHGKTVDVAAAPGALTNTGGTISLAADTLTLTGAVSTGAHEGLVGITLIDSGALTITAGGLPSVTTGTLSIGSLNGSTGSGSVTSIVLDSAPAGPDTLALFTSGALTAVTGISVGTLTGSVGNASFAGTDTITTLRDFGVTGGGLSLADASGLTLAGSIGVNGEASFTTVGDLTERVAGAYSGALTATSLSGSASGLIDLGNNANAFGRVDALTATAGPMTIADGVPLSIDGSLFSGGALSLASTGAIGETATGSFTAASLTASAGGSLSLTGGNSFSTLAGAAATGALSIGDSLALTVAATADVTGSSVALSSGGQLTQLAGTGAGGTISATSGGISLTSTGGDIGFGGTLSATQFVQFVALTGTVNETDGTATGALNAASAGGKAHAIFLTGVNTLGAISGLDATTGDATVFAKPQSGSATVSVTGANSAAGTLGISLTGTASVLGLTGTLDAAEVDLGAAGGIIQTGGGITAGTLTADAGGGAAALTSTANAVETLGASSGEAGFSFTDGGASGAYDGTLSVVGAVSTGSLSTIALTAPGLNVDAPLTATGGKILLATDALSITGSVSTGAGTGLVAVDSDLLATLTIDSGNFGHIRTGELALGSTDGSTASGVATITISSAIDLSSTAPTLGLFTTVPGRVNGTGGITVGTLIGDAGDVSLAGPNAVGTIGIFTATSFSLTQAGALSVAGPLAAPVTTLTAGTITVPGTITALTSLTLSATVGGITEGGTITTGLLSGFSPDSIDLTGATPATNRIIAVAGLSGHGILLDDGRDLAVTGLLASNQGTTSFDVTGSIDAHLGTLTGAAVTGSATGSALLTGTTNDFGTFADFSANGVTVFDSAAALTVGAVNGGTTGIGIDAPAAAIQLTGLVTSPDTSITGASIDVSSIGSIDASGTLTLSATGAITGEGGITAGTLTGGSGTAGTSLTGSANDIGVLGNFGAGSFTLVQAAALSVGGTLTSTVATLSAGTLTIPGEIAASTSLDLVSGSGITESGAISTGTLTGSALVDASLTGTNAIGTLGSFSAATLELHDGGDLEILGPVDAATSFSLVTTGSVTEPASGSITTSVLSANVGGTLSLLGTANDIGSLGDITSPDGFSYSQTAALTIAGTISGGSFATITSGNLLTVATTGSITSADTSLTGSAIAIAGTLSGTSLTTLTSIASLTATAGDITEVGAAPGDAPTGAVDAGTLTGSATGDVALRGPNSIPTLGAFGATNFDLLDTGVSLAAIGGPQSISGSFELDAKSISIGGFVSAAAATLTASAGTISETAAGGFEAGSLTGSSSAGAAFDSAQNFIGTLGNFTASSFVLDNDGTLDVAGTVTAASVSLGAAALQIDGFVNAGTAGAVTLTASGTNPIPGSGTIDESAAGSIAAATLTGSANGSASLVGVNTITTLQAFSAAPLTLDDSTGLTIASGATVSGSYIPAGGGDAVSGAVSLAVGGVLAIDGTIDATGETLWLAATQVTESGRVIAGSLTGTTSGATSLTTASNAISGIGSFTANGFSLVDDVALLTVAGPLQGGASVSVSNLGTGAAAGSLLVSGLIGGTEVSLHADQLLSITGTIDSLAALALSAGTGANTGTLNETGSIVTGSLTGNVQGVASLTGNGFNSITTLGSFTATGGLTLVDDTALSIVGPVVSGPFLDISTDSSLSIGGVIGGAVAFGGSFITINGTIVATTSLKLTASGTTSQGTNTPGTILELAGGAVVTPLFSGSAGGDIDLSLPSANRIDAIGPLSAGGLTIDDTVDLAITGPVVSTAGAAFTDAGHAITVDALAAGTTTITGSAVSLAAGSMTIPGSIDAGSSISLAAIDAVNAALGTISETGALVTPSLTGSASGSASFLSTTGANEIASLDGFAAAGFALNDSTPLTTTGTVSGGSALSISAAALTLAGMVDATSEILVATSGTLSESGAGALSATSLTGSASGAATLGGANTLSSLGSFTSAGFTLNDIAPLTIAGPLAGGPGVTLIAASLTIPGTLTADTLALSIGGTLAEAGSVNVTSLTGSIHGAASFTGSNSIGTLGNFTAAGLVLDDAAPLQVAGTLTSPTATLAAASLDIPGVIDVTDLALTSAGSISESGTLLVSGTLSGSAAGTATLTDPGFSNRIATLGSFTSAALALNDGATLIVAGPVDGHASVVIDDSTNLTIPGTLNGDATTLIAANLGITGSITAATSLALSIGGTVTAPGSITTALLSGTAGGAASFSGSNSIASAGPFTAAGFTLNDTPDLTIAGPIDGGDAVTITGAGALTVASSITGVTTSLTAASIDLPGSIAATTLALTSTSGAITEAGSITAGALTGSAATSASLTGTNSISALGDFTATGFALNDAAALTVTGALAGGPSVAIADAQALSVPGSITGETTALTAASIDDAGAITAADALTLVANAGDITASGSVTTAALSGSATGSVALTGTNSIAALGDFIANGFALLRNTIRLAVTGTVQAGGNATLSGAASIDVPGSITAGTIALTAAAVSVAGTIDAPGELQVTASGGDFVSTGSLDTALLEGSASGTAALTGTNQVAELASFSAASFTLDDGAALIIAGPLNGGALVDVTGAGGLSIPGSVTGSVTELTASSIDIPGSIAAGTSLAMTASGAITESGGITTPLLTIPGAGSVALTGGNSIGSLGAITAAGFTLNNAPDLSVTGIVNGQSLVAINETGALTVASGGAIDGDSTTVNAAALTLAGQITAASQLTLGIGGGVAETGTVTTALLTGSTGGQVQLGGANQIAALGDFTSGGSFALQDVTDLGFVGALNALSGNITAHASGIDEAAGASIVTGVRGLSATVGTITLGSPGTITLAGMLDAPTILVGTSTGGSSTGGNSSVGAPSLVTWDGNSIITGASEVPGATNPPFPSIFGTTPGIYVIATDFRQTGSTVVNANGRPGTIEITLAHRTGSVLFDQNEGLDAPHSELFINLDLGFASGRIDVAGLNISYVEPGSNTPSNLFGEVDNEQGPAASGAASIRVLPNSGYRLNSCPIQSVNCILVSPIIVPVTDPVDDVEVTSPRRRRDDDDLIIPNVGEEDF